MESIREGIFENQEPYTLLPAGFSLFLEWFAVLPRHFYLVEILTTQRGELASNRVAQLGAVMIEVVVVTLFTATPPPLRERANNKLMLIQQHPEDRFSQEQLARR